MSSQPAVAAESRTTSASASASGSRSALAKAIALAVVAAAVVNAIIAAVARGPLDASSEFQPLTAPVFLMWTVIGVVVGALAWRLITRRSARPASLLRWLVPTVVVASLIPDVLVLVADSMPGTSVTAVVALMAMHLATAAVAVPTFQRFLPATD